MRRTCALLALALLPALGGCDGDDLTPAVGVYRFDGPRSDLGTQLLQLVPAAARAAAKAVVEHKAAEVRGFYDLRADGSASMSRRVPAGDGGFETTEGAGHWTLDGDKVTLRIGGEHGAPQVQILQHQGDALFLEEERHGVWIRLVFTRAR